jgi:hypothetical protein
MLLPQPGYWLLVVGVAAVASNFLPVEFLATVHLNSFEPKTIEKPLVYARMFQFKYKIWKDHVACFGICFFVAAFFELPAERANSFE